ncbi:TPA: carbonic anhydrase family protein [Enterobacter kobei]|uniref:carbonic anhydrase n=1 Tax=Enterobacter TaxID=547 RepID=UPI00049EA346|nr:MULTISPECIES: carbonic anhydrase family protein [Enterobacter]ELJ5853004.1 carbonic anhydrase family protein [Enterobacter kobei]KDF46974.1 carbonic anhydrase [Enterobacter kobei]MCE1979595.1 carbonic anhydrase family protein [Enterobacter kobei]MCK6825818.1 carbonic anhydrase family protein [Enterobacter kobei]QIB83948.1 carbonic anhydrase family protein [Enterobacter sp. T2]
MKHITGKAALIALSMISTSAFASHWSYEGEGSPEHWGELDEAYKTCQNGMNQSPINIESTANAHFSPLKTHYSDGPMTLTNNGHTIQASEKADTRDTITLDNQAWTLQQFHFHAPSENTVHGKKYAMEMHLVHKNNAGELTVVAVMFDKGAANPELDKLWSVMPQQAEQNISIKQDLNLNKLLPVNKTYWRFSGSLTTPPCSEGVTWIVLKHPLTLSAEQLEKFTHTMHHDNNRPVQALHGRLVVE